MPFWLLNRAQQCQSRPGKMIDKRSQRRPPEPPVPLGGLCASQSHGSCCVVVTMHVHADTPRTPRYGCGMKYLTTRWSLVPRASAAPRPARLKTFGTAIKGMSLVRACHVCCTSQRLVLSLHTSLAGCHRVLGSPAGMRVLCRTQTANETELYSRSGSGVVTLLWFTGELLCVIVCVCGPWMRA